MRRLALAPLCATLLVLPQSSAPASDIGSLMLAASRWVVGFEQQLSGLLFRERYHQSSTSPGNQHEVLTLEANVFLLRPEGAPRFVTYRDVYRAAGQDVTDHPERLQKLLMDGSAGALVQVRRLTDESARYNLGRIRRNTNVPTLAFEYLRPSHMQRLRVRHAGRERVDGRDLTVVEFEEIGQPTIVRGAGDTDAPASGRYWIDPTTGAVPRARIELPGDPYNGRLEVSLVLHPGLNVWVPAEMKESWLRGTYGTRGTARYDEYRRVAVTTEEVIKK